MEHRSFHDEIRRNKRSSVLLALTLSIIIVALVFTFSYVFAPEYLLVVLPLSILFVISYSYISWMYGDQVVLRTTGARPAEGREHQPEDAPRQARDLLDAAGVGVEPDHREHRHQGQRGDDPAN